MRKSAVLRIALYGFMLLALLAALIAGLGVGNLHFNIGGGGYTAGGGSVDASKVQNLQIDWAAGSVTILTADTDTITFSESETDATSLKMGYKQSGNTLYIDYSSGGISIGLISTPKKDLTVTVPQDWICNELELDGASLSISIRDVSVKNLDIDGAANNLQFEGSLQKLNCDGAANDLTVLGTTAPEHIDLDGASIRLTLTLPEGTGYIAELEGLSCNLHSDYDHTHKDGKYVYGNEACRIEADGVSCSVTICKP